MRPSVVGLLIFAFAAALPPAAHGAETYTPTRLTAEAVFAKAVAARGRLKHGAYHRVEETTRSGGTVHIDAYEGEGKYVETQREGPFTIAYGIDGDTEWDQDENGAVTFESGFHVSDDPFNAAIDAKPKTVADSPVKVLGITGGDPACIVVEVTPQKGLVQHRYYDAKTFLLRRIETTDYTGQTTTYAYDDFHTAYGLTYAQSITFSDSHPENTAHTRVLAFEPVSPSLVHAAPPANKPLFDLGGRAAVKIPADFTEHGIIVRLTIAGRGLDFELDSGASSLVLDASVARQLGLTVSDMHRADFGGDFVYGRTQVADLGLGDLHAHNVTIESIPFDQNVGDRKVVGLLGGDFFATQRVAVNFKDDTLTVMPSVKAAPASPWVSVPIQVDDRVPRTHAKFNAVDGAFIVDLGADETMLYPHFFRQFHPNRAGDVMGQVVGIGREAIDFHRYTFSRFDLGDLAFADASAIVAQGAKFEDLDYDGLLGRNILSDFNLIFDYPNQKLYVESLVQ